MSDPTKEESQPQVGSDGLVRLLGDALCDAVDHLDYIGWGDEWERGKSKSVEPAIRNAINQYQTLFPDAENKPDKQWVCDRCGRVFKERICRMQHKRTSTKCQPNRTSSHP